MERNKLDNIFMDAMNTLDPTIGSPSFSNGNMGTQGGYNQVDQMGNPGIPGVTGGLYNNSQPVMQSQQPMQAMVPGGANFYNTGMQAQVPGGNGMNGMNGGQVQPVQAMQPMVPNGHGVNNENAVQGGNNMQAQVNVGQNTSLHGQQVQNQSASDSSKSKKVNKPQGREPLGKRLRAISANSKVKVEIDRFEKILIDLAEQGGTSAKFEDLREYLPTFINNGTIKTWMEEQELKMVGRVNPDNAKWEYTITW